MGTFVGLINQILFFCYSALDQTLQRFGLSWLGLVVGFATISVVLRLFASNLVGTAISMRDTRRANKKKADKQNADKKKG